MISVVAVAEAEIQDKQELVPKHSFCGQGSILKFCHRALGCRHVARFLRVATPPAEIFAKLVVRPLRLRFKPPGGAIFRYLRIYPELNCLDKSEETALHMPCTSVRLLGIAHRSMHL